MQTPVAFGSGRTGTRCALRTWGTAHQEAPLQWWRLLILFRWLPKAPGLSKAGFCFMHYFHSCPSQRFIIPLQQRLDLMINNEPLPVITGRFVWCSGGSEHEHHRDRMEKGLAQGGWGWRTGACFPAVRECARPHSSESLSSESKDWWGQGELASRCYGECARDFRHLALHDGSQLELSNYKRVLQYAQLCAWHQTSLSYHFMISFFNFWKMRASP
jgi:hypothetical protein